MIILTGILVKIRIAILLDSIIYDDADNHNNVTDHNINMNADGVC